MKKLWSIFRGFLTLIGFSVFMLSLLGAWSLFHKPEDKLPAKIVLGYTFYGTPADAPDAPAWLARLMPVDPTLSEVTSALYRAAKDSRVESLAVRLADGNYVWSDVQELRAAIATFRAAGKKTYVFSESFGDLYPGMAEYYLATAFDEIWIQPVGGVAITGFHAEVPYFKKVLDRLGVTPEIIQKGDYKTAPESALLDAMSDAQRETLHGILASMMTDFFDGVSAGRKIPAGKIGGLIDNAPYTALEAKERNLVDTVGYSDQLMLKLFPEEANQKDEDRDMVDAVDYLYSGDHPILKELEKKEAKLTDGNKQINGVALVYVTGMIVSGDSYSDGTMMGEKMAYAGDISDALLDAADDPDTRAVILRVDSPGGSPAASETIRRAVEVVRAKGKYVVVSMGGEATSGGYWVSVDADKIFAQTGTLTGSIGVFGGKASFAGLWSKLGVNWDGVELGANATLWSSNSGFSEPGRAAVQHMLDDVYDAFIDRVAKGRDFAPDIVEGMAQGRVWTGRQAKERGLVDEIGGLRDAMADVAERLGVASIYALDIYQMPEPPTPFDGLRGLMLGGVGVYELLSPVFRETALLRHPELGIVRAQGFAFSR